LHENSPFSSKPHFTFARTITLEALPVPWDSIEFAAAELACAARRAAAAKTKAIFLSMELSNI
jgi:hypothetical protein